MKVWALRSEGEAPQRSPTGRRRQWDLQAVCGGDVTCEATNASGQRVNRSTFPATLECRGLLLLSTEMGADLSNIATEQIKVRLSGVAVNFRVISAVEEIVTRITSRS